MRPFISSAVHVDGASLNIPQQFTSQLRRADEFIRLAVAATDKALAMCPGWQDYTEESGLFVGTAFGPMQTNFDVLGLIADENQTSPTLFSHSVFNSAAGYLARLFQISGSSQTYTDFSFPFFQALEAGAGAVSTGRLKQCLVLQVETYSDLLMDARQRTDQSALPWETGCVCWVLTDQDYSDWSVDHVILHNHSTQARSFFQREEFLHVDKEKIPCPTPLNAAIKISEMLTENNDSNADIACTITAPYGTVNLKLLQG